MDTPIPGQFQGDFDSHLAAIERYLADIGGTLHRILDVVEQRLPPPQKSLTGNGAVAQNGLTAEAADVPERTPNLQTAPPAGPVRRFELMGSVWHLEFGANEKAVCPNDWIGLKLYKVVLQKPDKIFRLQEWEREAGIIRAIEGEKARPDKVTDSQGLRNIDAEIDSRVKEKSTTVNPERLKEVEQQLAQLRENRRKMKDKAGRPRSFLTVGGRARRRINNALKRARKEIGKEMPEFAKYLKATVIFDEQTCSYSPRQHANAG